MSDNDFVRPHHWKVPAKPADNRALDHLIQMEQKRNPGARVSASEVIRCAVHEQCRRVMEAEE